MDEKLGVFVTLNKNNDLRGCIGYAEPIEPAINATIEVAIAAAFNDPRFSAVTKEEFQILNFEVTVLTKPEIIHVAHPDQYFEEIEIGRDGLIIQKRIFKRSFTSTSCNRKCFYNRRLFRTYMYESRN